jgi:hypothetical protein
MYVVMDQLYIGNQPMLHVAGVPSSSDMSKYFANRILFPLPNLDLFDRLSS